MTGQTGAGAEASLAVDGGFAVELAFARRLADVAAELALEYFRRGVSAQLKPDGSQVTEADVAVERRLRQLIAEERPLDGVLGEELGETGSTARRWVLDPIDGTSHFIAGRPAWGNHVALELEGEIVVGVITRPVLGTSWWASRGAGAHRSGSGSDPNTRRLAVSRVSELRESRVTLWNHAEDPTVQRLKGHCRWIHPELDCLLRVAEGELDALVDRSGKPWDLAPAVVLVEEAGGRFSDRDGGRRLDLGDGRFSNGLIHAQLEQLLAAS
ncbi:MAG: inositol monophosphatase family protein [Deltaproteobacteria bacterium]